MHTQQEYHGWPLVPGYCLVTALSFGAALFWASPADSLYNWWFAPLDMLALCLVAPMMAGQRSASAAFLGGTALLVLQVLALGFLIWQSESMMVWHQVFGLLYGLRFILGFMRARSLPAVEKNRRCQA